MADIAFVFHWPPDVMDAMPVEDLALWRAKARDRLQQQQEVSQNGSR